MKPNGIQFQSYMIECATSLGQELEYPTDTLLLPLVQLQNMAEVNHRSLSTVDHMNGLDLEMKVQFFQAELAQWKHSFPLVSQQASKFERSKAPIESMLMCRRLDGPGL